MSGDDSQEGEGADLLEKFIEEHSKDVADDDILLLSRPSLSSDSTKRSTTTNDDKADTNDVDKLLPSNIASVKEELARRRKAYDKFLLQQTVDRNADQDGEAQKKLTEIENSEAKEKAAKDKKPSQTLIHTLFILGILWFAMRLIGFDLDKIYSPQSSNTRAMQANEL